jgi:hypothetical protein
LLRLGKKEGGRAFETKAWHLFHKGLAVRGIAEERAVPTIITF